MNPKDIAKMLTSLDFNDGVVIESDGNVVIPEGVGPFDIHFNRGTVVKVDYIAKGGEDPYLYYAGIDPSGMCFKTRNRKSPPIMIMERDRWKAYKNYGIKLPRRKYMCPFKHMITFNSKNVIRVEKSQ